MGCLLIRCLGAAALLGCGAVCAAGPLDPPAGAVAPTMKTLGEVEPRRAVQSLPSSVQSMYVISEPGSYYLTGDIVRAGGKRGIEIASPHVTLDLSGFSLVGAPGAATFNVGIAVTGPHFNLVVRNGTIRGWGYGLSGNHAERSLFEDLAVLDSTAGGIEIGDAHSSIFRNLRVVSASPNEVAILAGDNCIVDGCVVEGPVSSGIVGRTSCAITRCSVVGAGTGISARDGSVVSGCSVGDAGTGIFLIGGLAQGCSIWNCDGAGVSMRGGASVLGSSVRQCAEGIVGDPSTAGNGRIEGNSLLGNGVGLRIDSTGSTIVRNVIQGSTTAAAQIVPGNAVGTIQATPFGAGPWDNLAF